MGKIVKPTALLFDLDGTLVDTAPDLVAACNHALSTIGCGPVPYEDIRLAAGHGGMPLLAKALEITGAGDRVSAAGLHPVFLAYYEKNIASLGSVFPTLLDLVEAANAAGIKTAIVTNKPETLTHLLIEALNLANHFPVVIAGDTLAQRKPDPAPIREAMGRLGVASAVMIGDSYTDRQAAENAQIPFIGVGFGYGPMDVSADDLQFFADQPRDLRSQVSAVVGPF